MEMTPRERFRCALNRGEPDRVPYCETSIDPMVDARLLDLESPEEIPEVAPGGGYIVSNGNSIFSYCKPENVIAMAEAIQKYGKYPIRID